MAHFCAYNDIFSHCEIQTFSFCRMIYSDTLPDDVREKLAELDLELSEGDITKKGYDKKRNVLLAPYKNSLQTSSGQLEMFSYHQNSHNSHILTFTR